MSLKQVRRRINVKAMHVASRVTCSHHRSAVLVSNDMYVCMCNRWGLPNGSIARMMSQVFFHIYNEMLSSSRMYLCIGI